MTGRGFWGSAARPPRASPCGLASLARVPLMLREGGRWIPAFAGMTGRGRWCLVDGGDFVCHSALVAPVFGGGAFSLDGMGVDECWVFDFDDGF